MSAAAIEVGVPKDSKRGRIAIDANAKTEDILRVMPPGYRRIGRVQIGARAPGVLALIEKSGEYVQLNELGTSTLDQRKVRAALGLPNPLGKPRLGYEVRQPYTVRLEPSLAAYLEQLGNGSLAAGITAVAEAHRDRDQRKGVNRLADIQTSRK